MNKHQVYAIYSEVLDLPPDRRKEMLRTRCGDNVVLLREVSELLEAAEAPAAQFDAQFDEVRNSYWRSVAGQSDPPDEDLSGEQVSRWQLLEQVGRGGIATVYRARRIDGAFSQIGAFKVLRRGLDTEDLINRFRAEREILSTLEHPGIARILDGGTLADGRPFLVMEFVNGTNIVDYARTAGLDQSDRLRLVRDIATTLHHAHQRLIVHRDIKPSNVMVSDEGQVRLLDFGIAKILDPSDSPIAAQLTRTGVALMTPAYGSPEQFAGHSITTATDTYQLGLLLAQLLTDHRPLKNAAGLVEPVMTGITNSDLTAIVQMATREEAQQRYATILDFAEDIDRYLGLQPVQAHADSWRYRLVKFSRRRPYVLPLALAAIVVSILYLVTITSYTREVERERELVQQTQQFMIDIFQSPDPRAPLDPSRGRDITVVEALQLGEASTLEKLADRPQLQVSLGRAIGSVYEALGQYTDAIRVMTQVAGIQENLLGPQAEATLQSLRKLAQLHRTAGDLAAAQQLSDRQLTIAVSADVGKVALGLAQHDAALQTLQTGSEKDATELLRTAVSTLLEDLDSAQVDKEALEAVITQGQEIGDPVSSITALEALTLSVVGADSVEGLLTRIRSATALNKLGAHEAAQARLEAAIPLLAEELGPTHPAVVNSRNNLAIVYSSMGDFSAAEQIHRELLEISRQTIGPDSHPVALRYQNLATVIARQGRSGEALALYQQALKIFDETYGADHRNSALTHISLAALHLQSQMPVAAERSADQALTNLPSSDVRLNGIASCLKALAEIAQHKANGETRLQAAQAALADRDVPPHYQDLCGLEGSTAKNPT